MSNADIDLIGDLRELIRALDRRMPRLEGGGERRIARDAAALRDNALARIASLEALERSRLAARQPWKRMFSMFRSVSRPVTIGAWVAAFLVVAVAGALSGVSVTIGSSLLWFVACVVPPAVMMFIWRGAPPPTVAEILAAVERRD
jgi:hypothetical protein